MHAYHYQIATEPDEPIVSLDKMSTIEAATPFEAVDALRYQGRLPNSETPIYVRVVTSVHDNGMPAKMISVPLVPLDMHVEYAQQ